MNSKERFTGRVDHYVKYRPGYPKEAIDYLYDTVGFGCESQIADIGAGTGIFTRLLLERGSHVTAVEPNQAMRESAEQMLHGEPKFRAVAGSAEMTGLADGCVDFIVCAQAFHWFDRTAAQKEFHRILRTGGKAVLVWNSRLTAGSPFLTEYEKLLHTYGIDYAQVNHRNISQDHLRDFFQQGSFETARFNNRQIFDFDGLKGRLLSSSYSPQAGHPNYMPMMSELRELFDRNKQDGKVFFDYVTEVYWGGI